MLPTLTLVFKTPDVIDRAVDSYIELQRFLQEEEGQEVDEEGLQDLRERMVKAGNKWIEYGEYLDVRLNLETGEIKAGGG